MGSTSSSAANSTNGSVAGFTVLIPARLASTRLPDKPLADIAGKPMIVRVAERAMAAQTGNGEPVAVVVAADHASIVQACTQHHIRAVLTRPDHVSGSDRLAEACDLLGLPDTHTVVNVQGDEPLMAARLITQVAELLNSRPDASMSTAAHVIDSDADFTNPNVVKVVLDAHHMALYFSRATIPFDRDGKGFAGPFKPLRHIGIYGYRAGFLRQFPHLPPAPIEQLEALEQLRALWHGYRIAVVVTDDAPGPGVDTPADLARVRALFAA